ncbi:plasmid partitioning protein RepB [Rhizobium sp. LEGMi198b]|uniref:plasmid partitioning protein RepB n=1 Tax=unclassified Rhizobium TaxID=2613769 RepID=UPI000CDF3F9F|nr:MULTISPECIES: plasmid partitioning protein RepB [Rhizobium]AVA26636.1 plasmid partitioning protein RepB 3-1 [Rhizobium sp. NXC24]UWU24368.1 plasmid partitioning protein RepB [Rhizobium tropici]
MTKSPKRSSLAASFGLLAADINADTKNSVEQQVSASAPVRVGAGVIGATHKAISDIRDERDRLLAMLEAGSGGSTEIDTDLIDPSPFPDRLPDDNDESFAEFKKSIEEDGQKIPIQVRLHPTLAGRYQVIYGHRRLRAARELQRPIKALTLDMSDRDLVVVQGIENAARQDLSWIERALFAWRMDEAGIRPRDIYAALGIDDAELARMRSVYRVVPLDVIEAIGRAPKIGRPRWVEFGGSLKAKPDALRAIRETLSSDRVLRLMSNERFSQAMGMLKTPAARLPGRDIRDGRGKSLARLQISKKELKLMPETDRGVRFAAFLEGEIPALIAKFDAADKQDDS